MVAASDLKSDEFFVPVRVRPLAPLQMNLEPYKNCLALTKAVHINNNMSAPYRPCCWYGTHVSADSWDEYQSKINNLDVETNCKHCIDQDLAGIPSHKENFNDPDQLVFGVFFDNVCNLKCVTCGPSNSTQWIKDYNLLRPHEDIKSWVKLQTYTDSKIAFIKSTLANSNFKKLRLELYGGEPLIGVSILEFLDWLYEQPYANQTHIVVATNGTKYLPKIEKYIDKFGFSINFSIDGIDNTFEYLRTNAVFTEVESNIDRYMEFRKKHEGHISFGFNYTLSWMNSLHFADFYNWVFTRYPNTNVDITVLKGPNFLSINTLSLEKRKLICDTAYNRMKQFSDDNANKVKKEFQLVMCTETTPEGSYIEGHEYLTKLDSIRSKNYKELFEEVIYIIEGK